ncbi:MAG: mannitol dehydrogenase family protein, partial [Propionibacteriaceae bacterium]|nr:mannitol dehydrogenase family protein [Propionibacteriaceae bacterium]
MAQRHQPTRDLLTQAARTGSVSTPGYDPAGLRPGIAHIGVGNFHRAHQAVYLDDLAELGGAGEWGIRGLGLLHQDSRMGHALRRQGMAYTLTTRSPEGSQTRVVASIVDHVDLLILAGGAERALTDEAIRIVTLTIGEGGYAVPDASDLQASLPPPAPGDQRPQVHFLDLLYRALKARRKLGYEPFTIATCDNLVRNGHRAKQALVGYVNQLDPAFATWITANVSFPSSMVDRITPRTTGADREAVRKLGVDDAWPVVTEPFRQWIVEDSFPAGRPELEAVGVIFVTDVEPYERAKFRMLNASHQIRSSLGGLAGHEYVHDALRDPLMRATLRQFMSGEATPTLTPGVLDYADYGATILDR